MTWPRFLVVACFLAVLPAAGSVARAAPAPNAPESREVASLGAPRTTTAQPAPAPAPSGPFPFLATKAAGFVPPAGLDSDRPERPAPPLPDRPYTLFPSGKSPP